MKNKVIKTKNLPAKIPFFSSLTCYVALDYYNAPEWLWTLAIAYFSLVCLANIISLFTQERIDITDLVNEKTENNKKSKWQQKLEEIQNKQKNK